MKARVLAASVLVVAALAAPASAGKAQVTSCTLAVSAGAPATAPTRLTLSAQSPNGDYYRFVVTRPDGSTEIVSDISAGPNGGTISYAWFDAPTAGGYSAIIRAVSRHLDPSRENSGKTYAECALTLG